MCVQCMCAGTVKRHYSMLTEKPVQHADSPVSFHTEQHAFSAHLNHGPLDNIHFLASKISKYCRAKVKTAATVEMCWEHHPHIRFPLLCSLRAVFSLSPTASTILLRDPPVWCAIAAGIPWVMWSFAGSAFATLCALCCCMWHGMEYDACYMTTVDDNKMPRHRPASIKEKLETVQAINRGMEVF